MNIENKVAIVTGASKGIGKATALALAEAGAHLAISARSKKLLEETAQEIRKMGREVLTFAGDMSVEDDIRQFINATVEKFDRIDILVNNAGVGHFHKIGEMPTERWDEMFNLNIRGMFIATRETLPHLRKAGESAVVNVSSLAGKNVFVNGGGYAATKHAVMAFSRCLMLEERENGVRVLVMCPGSVATHFSRDPDDPRQKRITQPEDVAESIVHMIRLPQRAMVSEIDVRPTNP